MRINFFSESKKNYINKVLKGDIFSGSKKFLYIKELPLHHRLVKTHLSKNDYLKAIWYKIYILFINWFFIFGKMFSGKKSFDFFSAFCIASSINGLIFSTVIGILALNLNIFSVEIIKTLLQLKLLKMLIYY